MQTNWRVLWVPSSLRKLWYKPVRLSAGGPRFYSRAFTPPTTPRFINMANIPSFTLNDGKEIPVLGYGLGTANYKQNPNSPVDKELVKTVVLAIKTGYYHLDGAQVYGNETELGLAIKESGVPREKLYVTTKIDGVKPQNTQEAFETSLKKLGLDYVDQYLIHAPFFAKSPADIQAKWADLEAIHASGKAKSIGVSNFRKSDLEAILETAKIIPVINQIEFNPYLQHVELLEFQKKHGIKASAYAPLTAITKAAPGPVDGVYERLAKKYGVTTGEIALRWVVDQGIVAVTTSSNEGRLRQYLKSTEFELTKEEVEEITKEGKKKNFRGFWTWTYKDDDWQ
ncbi:hypothetical protein ONS96_007341 [Cadophora gregata f. sp. sojae]|nr:hypothetical protein ONS96_007341 [Cadophora gregata f. sp. sojae]